MIYAWFSLDFTCMFPPSVHNCGWNRVKINYGALITKLKVGIFIGQTNSVIIVDHIDQKSGLLKINFRFKIIIITNIVKKI